MATDWTATCDPTLSPTTLRWASRTSCFEEFLYRCRVALELFAWLAASDGECVCRRRQRHGDHVTTLRRRIAQQDDVIAHYRRTVVPQLRGDVTRVTSESQSLSCRLRHAEHQVTMKNDHIALLEKQRQELRSQLDAGKIDVPSFLLSMRQTLAQLETNLAQSHEERCKLFSDVSMLKTEKALVVRELRDTERRIESLQQESSQELAGRDHRISQLQQELEHAQSRSHRLSEQLDSQETRARVEKAAAAQEANQVRQENGGLREQIDIMFGILAKKDETSYKLCSKLLMLKKSRDQKDTEVLETTAKYQKVIGKVLDQLNDVNMENLLLVSNKLQHSQPQQYKMLLESLKFKIFLETENAGMTQECHQLRYENMFLQKENQRLCEELQEVRLRLLPEELREERLVLSGGRLTPGRRASATQTEPPWPLPTSPTPDTSLSSMSFYSQTESQQDAAVQEAELTAPLTASTPPTSPSGGWRRTKGRGRVRRPSAGVTWGQLLESEEHSDHQLDPAAVTQMIQLATAQTSQLDQLDDSLQLSTD